MGLSMGLGIEGLGAEQIVLRPPWLASSLCTSATFLDLVALNPAFPALSARFTCCKGCPTLVWSLDCIGLFCSLCALRLWKVNGVNGEFENIENSTFRGKFMQKSSTKRCNHWHFIICTSVKYHTSSRNVFGQPISFEGAIFIHFTGQFCFQNVLLHF